MELNFIESVFCGVFAASFVIMIIYVVIAHYFSKK